jgi:nitroimidazol reductase NimA-like FMN-containing flavoprotein (pyridoxamine 5'-phosphate oxidase superfamily)
MNEASPLRNTIEQLLSNQDYGVLCVADKSLAYGALVAFACAEDLTSLYFATPITTRKFSFLGETDRAAFVVDSRSEIGNSLMTLEALTITGASRELVPGSELQRAQTILLERHRHLGTFIKSPSCAVFAIDIERIIHVSRFQEVKEWVPPSRD